ncbi:hypothetical protein [Cryobacterium zhongshanensis]|uniref:Uncharacterized protein n=1 Tax=Cryobacterium zhongshanensis TaxID=2928153 RepID=A0AA41UGB3_9MICO|nr:hypothetical protein [Cryobacterium zhongshanensis]MCI4659543.1 hypothetical protein [Cryobacterium zhongshanensis]
MSAEMLIAVCNAPVYNTPHPEIVTDLELLLTRATDEALDQLTLLIRSREDGDAAIFEGHLTEAELEFFSYDRDAGADITAIRRALARCLFMGVLTSVFKPGTNDEKPSLNQEITWITASFGEQKRTLLATGGLSFGDEPTEAWPAIYLLDALNLFEMPFEKPDAEGATPVEGVVVRAGVQAAAWLAARGWVAKTAADRSALEELAYTLAEPASFLDAFDSAEDVIDEFIAASAPAA